MDTAVAENDGYTPEIEGLDYWDTELSRPERPVWFKWMCAIALPVMLVGILLGSGSYRVGSMMALVNCTLVAWAMVKLAEKRSVCCLFPIVFLTWLILGSSVAPIYFSIFNKEATYMYHESMLGGNIKYQSAVLAFVFDNNDSYRGFVTSFNTIFIRPRFSTCGNNDADSTCRRWV